MSDLQSRWRNQQLEKKRIEDKAREIDIIRKWNKPVPREVSLSELADLIK